MTTKRSLLVTVSLALSASSAIAQPPQQGPQQPMSFFITSKAVGDGGNLGGLAGADAHCQALGAAAGRGSVTWRAYLSQVAAGPLPVVNARDRIGNGPWYNATGQLIASNVVDLHADRNNVRKPTALDENGQAVNGVGDQPNQHDILTGSDSTGRAVAGSAAVSTSNNWTSNSTGNAIVGHHDRLGGPNASWNAVHSSRSCSQDDLVATGGAGLLYCFAIN
jgi:hypothetical protein